MAGKTTPGLSDQEDLAAALGYRRPMPVARILVLGAGGYPLCPRCGLTMDREYMAFCDRCGQRLDWRRYKKAALVYPEMGLQNGAGGGHNIPVQPPG